jgi:hypothetical protein
MAGTSHHSMVFWPMTSAIRRRYSCLRSDGVWPSTSRSPEVV